MRHRRQEIAVAMAKKEKEDAEQGSGDGSTISKEELIEAHKGL